MRSEREIEASTREKYEGAIYRPETICRLPGQATADAYADALTQAKFELVRRHGRGDVMLDVCCATGEHLLVLAEGFRLGIGADFSQPFLSHGQAVFREQGQSHLRLVAANGRQLPFRSGSIGTAYAFSALYHIPAVAEVIAEMARVLEPGGVCVLDLGNLHSLNTIACRAYPELAEPCHIPVRDMREILAACDLTVLEHRAFQLLPLWADRPRWLMPLLHPAWKGLLQRKIGGRMLDEWISGLPVLNRLAFRHLFACRKNP